MQRKHVRHFCLTCLFLFKMFNVTSIVFDSSQLPIVFIRVSSTPYGGRPVEIPDNPRVIGSMKIIQRPDGSRNFLTDKDSAHFLDFDGKIEIEIRGSTSQTLPKKPYGFSTLDDSLSDTRNVSLLGMPKENDWILNSLAFDPSLIRDYLVYYLYGEMGHYSPRAKFCEVVVNNDYKGLYLLSEKIKIDEKRVNIVKMTKDDNYEPFSTGGYMVKSDKTTDGDQVAWYMNGAPFIYDSPKPLLITARQKSYIYKYFNAFQNAMNNQNSNISIGFPSLIDIPSFVDFMIMNEISSNVDAYHLSTYFHKDRNGKLKAGPVWDFNLSFGNDLFAWGLDRSHTNIWMFDNVDLNGAKFWKDLYLNPQFKLYLSKRWTEITSNGQLLNYDSLVLKLNQLTSVIQESSIREHERWGTIGDLNDNLSEMKMWLKERMKWLNTKLYQTNIQLPELPDLVITAIQYHPSEQLNFPADSLEFLEITNNSDQIVNLAGMYFTEPGMSYVFPENSVIAPHSKIYLASNQRCFSLYYGLNAFGQFTRTLSNKSFHIKLADAFGNLIDEVHYFDSYPWPEEADGNGAYLRLNSLSDDNGMQSNWTAVSEVLGVDELANEMNYSYKYDSQNNLLQIIFSDKIIEKIYIYNITGELLQKANDINSATANIQLQGERNMVLIVKLILDNGQSQVFRFLK